MQILTRNILGCLHYIHTCEIKVWLYMKKNHACYTSLVLRITNMKRTNPKRRQQNLLWFSHKFIAGNTLYKIYSAIYAFV